MSELIIGYVLLSILTIIIPSLMILGAYHKQSGSIKYDISYHD